MRNERDEWEVWKKIRQLRTDLGGELIPINANGVCFIYCVLKRQGIELKYDKGQSRASRGYNNSLSVCSTANKGQNCLDVFSRLVFLGSRWLTQQRVVC